MAPIRMHSGAFASRKVRRAGIRVAGIAMVLGALLFSLGQIVEARIAGGAAKLPLKVGMFEEAIGYGGMIHHFKNYVLRTGEPVYARNALRSAKRAQVMLDALDKELARYNLEADLTRARDAIRAYSDRLPVIAEMYAAGAHPSEIDAAVRYDDTPALTDVATLRARVEQEVAARLRLLDISGMAMFLISLAGAGLAILIVATEHRQAEAAFHAAEEALERERAGSEEMKQFSYAVSHDLKAPINTVHLLLDEIRDGSDGQRLSEDQKELLVKSLATLERSQTQIEKLTQFAGMSEQRSVDEEWVNLNEQFAAVMEDLSADIEAAEAHLDVGHLPMIFANRAQLRVLCQNLVANAVRYRKPGQPVRIRICGTRTGDRFCLHVSDDGIGIAREHLERIFGLFSRLHRQDQIPGSGLGLSVCRRVARNMDGELVVESTPGEGSTFSLRVPIKRYAPCYLTAA